jgi:IclR family acetate operon transcriptional repressor
MPEDGRAGVGNGEGTGKERSGQVQALARALRILNVLAEHEAGLTLTEIAKAVGLAPSTTHRLLTTLQQESYVRFGREGGTWQVGVQAFVVGSAFTRTRDLSAIARPFMRELMENSGETVNLAVADQGEVIYLAQVECRQMMRALAKPGARVAMHCSAVGKALLAEMPPSGVEEIIRAKGLPRVTAHTIVSRKMLFAELNKARELGYAVDDEEHSDGLRCVAAPVFDEQGHAIAAISASGPKVRLLDSRFPALGRMVQRTAEEVTAAFGGRLPLRPQPVRGR